MVLKPDDEMGSLGGMLEELGIDIDKTGTHNKKTGTCG